MGRKHTEEAKAKIRAAALARYAVVPVEVRRDKAARRVSEWHANNPERVRDIKRQWYERNRDDLNKKAREKNKTSERREYMRLYAPKHRAENPALYTTYSHVRRAREVEAHGSHTEGEWLGKLEAYRGLCAYCGCRDATDRDHDVPLARGGSNDITNILPACGYCNSAKGTLTGEEYRKRLAGDGPSMDSRWARQLAEARCSRQE